SRTSGKMYSRISRRNDSSWKFGSISRNFLMTIAVSFSAKNPATRSEMLRAVLIRGFSDSLYVSFIEKSLCIMGFESRNSRHDSFQAESLWRVTLVPALRAVVLDKELTDLKDWYLLGIFNHLFSPATP